MGEIVTQPVTWEKWPPDKPSFETSADLFECLHELVEQKLARGQVRAFFVDEDVRWDLELGQNDRPATAAVFGQCVVSMGGIIESMTPEQYDARFSQAAD